MTRPLSSLNLPLLICYTTFVTSHARYSLSGVISKTDVDKLTAVVMAEMGKEIEATFVETANETFGDALWQSYLRSRAAEILII